MPTREVVGHALALVALVAALTSCQPRGATPTMATEAQWRAGPGAAPAAGIQSPPLVAAAQARAWLGRPYCWGGTGPWCYDCSGLTFAAWWAAGRRIPRTSTAQRAGLRRVSLAEAEVGDVAWRPGHVGLYVGDGWVIHSPGRGHTVRYQPLARFAELHRP